MCYVFRVRRVLFRILYALLLVAIFLGGAWLAFQRSIVGRSIPVPELVGKSLSEAKEMGCPCRGERDAQGTVLWK